jgi:Nif-specific regulatory protein
VSTARTAVAGEPAASDEPARLRRERDLYRRLLGLGDQEALEPFLKEALALVVDVASARRGYLEVRSDADPVWYAAEGLPPGRLEDVRAAISRGIVAEALASGRTVETASALLDPRFESRESVRIGHIEAVLCVPLGGDPPLGVLYLEGPEGRSAWPGDARASAELVARHLAPFAERLVARARERGDATEALRREMRLEGVVGRSRALARVLEQARLVAPLDVNVLLTGESGTGKNQIARVIHQNGPRARGPFVEFNCATLQENLVESELFGSQEGAHSTARRAAPGKVAAAEGGTLLLDEIGEISLSIQAKLLQLIQTREYYPLGASKPERADVRVIAASNADLEQAVARGRFREDLYYRLQVLPIRLPALRERSEDIPDLARHLCAEACVRHALAPLDLSRGALRVLESAEWPGNVRQLAHALEAAVIRAAGERARQVEARHVFPDQRGGSDGSGAPLTFQEATRQFQRELVRRTLEETGWNVTEAARVLDVARSHVYNLIKAFGLERHAAATPARG